jgi:L-alanine-DL-glutamate epimerase-like enolase superfamily enzyme
MLKAPTQVVISPSESEPTVEMFNALINIAYDAVDVKIEWVYQWTPGFV